MDENKVMGLSVTTDLSLHLCIEYAHSSGNEKLLTFVNDNEEILKSIMEKDLFGNLDKHEKLVVGHLIQLHDRESQNMTCNHHHN